jgi:hypothetical protein
VIICLSVSYLIILSLTLNPDITDYLIGDLCPESTCDEIKDIWVFFLLNLETNISVLFDLFLLTTLSQLLAKSFLVEAIVGLLNLL